MPVSELSVLKIIFISLVVSLQTCDGQNITARLGENIMLPCQAPSFKHVVAVEWTRPDLNPDLIFFFVDNHIKKSEQHPLYRDRVDLLEKRINNNVSVILSNVNVNDSGTYECRVKEQEAERVRRHVIDSQPINTITLTVLQSDDTAKATDRDVNVGMIAGLCVGGFVFLFIVVVLIVGIRRINAQKTKQTQDYERPPEQEAETRV